METRLRRVFPHVPILIPAAAYAWYFARLSVAVQDGYGTFGFDLGIFDQGMWLLSHAHAPFVTVMGRNLFGDHTSFILALIVPLYWIHEAPQTLLVIQAVIIAAGSLPIYALARRLTSSTVLATLLAGTYLCNPALQDGNLEQFHPDAFLVPGLALAIYAAITWRPRLLWLTVVICLLVKEDAAALVVPLGIWVAWRRDRRQGLAIVAVAVTYLLVAYEIVIAILLGTASFYAGRVPFGGIGGLASTAIQHPGRLWDYLRGAGRPFYLWQLGCSTGWIWLVSPEIAAIGVLSLAENLLSTFGYMHQITYHYSLALVPVLALGTVWAVGRLKTPARRRVATGAVVAGAVLSCCLWGLAPFSRSPTPYVEPATAVAQINQVHALPADAVVSAYDRYVPHVDQRVRCYQWPTPFKAENWGLYRHPGRRLAFAPQVAYLFLPTHLAPADRDVLATIRSQFRVVQSNATATLWRRVRRRGGEDRGAVRAPRT